MVYNLGILIVLMLSGLVVGWRVRDGVVNFFIAIALALLFTYAMSWLGVFVEQLVPAVEVAQQVAFTTIFPIVPVERVRADRDAAGMVATNRGMESGHDRQPPCAICSATRIRTLVTASPSIRSS